MKKISLIGAGLIGQERLKAVRALQQHGHDLALMGVYDPFQPKLVQLAATFGFTPAASLADLLRTPTDLLIVSCPHDTATEMAVQALRAGHRVLLEKPLGRNAAEAGQIVAAAQSDEQLVLGLNYRFMPGVAALTRDVREQHFGQPVSLSITLGHGGRPGDEKTWKLDPVRCGGGALLDPGIHVLDLARRLLGGEIGGPHVTSWSGFWKTGIEEHVTIAGQTGATAAHLDISVVRWRSLFEIHFLGTDGYGLVTGRGRSYGPQIYRRGKRWGWQHSASQAASEETVIENACEDSFRDELAGILGLTGDYVQAPVSALAESALLMRAYQQLKAHL